MAVQNGKDKPNSKNKMNIRVGDKFKYNEGTWKVESISETERGDMCSPVETYYDNYHKYTYQKGMQHAFGRSYIEKGLITNNKEKSKTMANEKYYRVKKDNFLWSEGAILKQDLERGKESEKYGYAPINDIWDTTENNGTEYITGRIIENNPEWFERVYEVNLLTKTVYRTKEEAKEFITKNFKD